MKFPKNKKILWRISAYATVVKNGKVLCIMEYGARLWELPGGGIEVNESMRKGLVREFYEETGYTITPLDPVPYYVGENVYRHPREKKLFHFLFLVYRAKLSSAKQNKRIVNTVVQHEIQKIQWVPIARLNAKNCNSFLFPVIRILKKKEK